MGNLYLNWPKLFHTISDILTSFFLHQCIHSIHGGMRGMHPPYDRSRGDNLYNHPPPPYKGDEQMKSILHNTQIITPEEVVSYIDDEIIFSRKFE